MRLYCVLLLTALAKAQAPTGAEEGLRIGGRVKAPKVLRQIEPEFSPSARADHVQGTVVIELVVNELGKPVNLKLLSPLGFGLDERAIAAVEKWEFKPGTRDGKPVSTQATIEVSFRFPDVWFDEKLERQRTSFNVALGELSKLNPSAASVERAVKQMQELSRQRFPAAMYRVGIWATKGEHIEEAPEEGLALLQKAAAKNYGPALYEIAARRIDGRDSPKDVDKGLDEMREAALMGSAQAQFVLGDRYEKGDGLTIELDRARRYFRLCAVQGFGLCQFRLGALLFNATDRLERDYVQAVALFQLAAPKRRAIRPGDFGQRNCQAHTCAIQLGQQPQRSTRAKVAWVNGLGLRSSAAPFLPNSHIHPELIETLVTSRRQGFAPNAASATLSPLISVL